MNTTIIMEDIQLKLSHSFLYNWSLDDNLVKFAIKARLNILPANFTLYLWNRENDRRCPFCKSHTESIAHLLNGCFTQFGNFYSRRHNRIVDRLAAFIKLVKPRVPVYVDKMAETIFPEFKTELSEIRNRKVDIVLVDKSERSCYLVEVKVCFDLYLNQSYDEKISRYQDLVIALRSHHYDVKLLVMCFVSLGCVKQDVFAKIHWW